MITRTNVYLNADEHRQLRLIAVEERTTMSALIRKAVTAYLAKKEGK